MKMYKQIYSKDGNKAVYIVVRFGKWMATDQKGVIKDKIYIFFRRWRFISIIVSFMSVSDY